MLTGRIAVLQTTCNSVDESALTELSKAGFECSILPLDTGPPLDLSSRGYCVIIVLLSAPLDSALGRIQKLVKEDAIPLIFISSPETLPALGPFLEYPSVEWLMAPCESTRLCDRVTAAARRARLATLLGDGLSKPQTLCLPVSLEAFVEQSLRNVAGALLDIHHVTRAIASSGPGQEVCHLFDCPCRSLLTEAVRDAICVLEKTRSSFKSKELGELRRRLEVVLKT